MRHYLYILLLASTVLHAADAFAPLTAEERIKPVGQVRTSATKTKKAPAQQAEAKQPEKPRGEQVYGQYCQVCHQGGLAGAPKFRDEAEWKPKLASKDIDALTASAIKGINAMPARGTCNDCSDEDIKAAVEYMLPQS